MVCGTARVGREVAGDIEDHLGRRTGSRSDVGDREGASGTEGHGHRVGPVVATGEVESRASRVVLSHRTDVEIAEAGLAGHGQVAGNGRGVEGHATVACHPERPGLIGAEGARQSRAGAGIEDARRSERVVCGTGRRRHRGGGALDDCPQPAGGCQQSDHEGEGQLSHWHVSLMAGGGPATAHDQLELAALRTLIVPPGCHVGRFWAIQPWSQCQAARLVQARYVTAPGGRVRGYGTR